MDNYKIIVKYDGTRYKGWQIQNSTSDTIQGKLTDILNKLTGQQVDVIGSGRTDAGVHAKGQVANFHATLPSEMSEKDLLLYINKYLPMDIAVTSLKKVNDRFHARFSAKSKSYLYRIYVSPVSDPFEHKYVYTYLDQTLDILAMQEAANYLTGCHDFKSFCGNKKMKKSTERTIFSIDISEKYDQDILKEIDIVYTGDGFLQNMVRILTGTLMEVGTGKIGAVQIPQILEAFDREQAGFTAPAQGLTLLEVNY